MLGDCGEELVGGVLFAGLMGRVQLEEGGELFVLLFASVFDLEVVDPEGFYGGEGGGEFAGEGSEELFGGHWGRGKGERGRIKYYVWFVLG